VGSGTPEVGSQTAGTWGSRPPPDLVEAHGAFEAGEGEGGWADATGRQAACLALAIPLRTQFNKPEERFITCGYIASGRRKWVSPSDK
jgi:hypothetical protein